MNATENTKVILTERNIIGQCAAEYEVERVWSGSRIVQETVRETRYNTDTGYPEFERRAVEPNRARDIVTLAFTGGGMLDRRDA